MPNPQPSLSEEELREAVELKMEAYGAAAFTPKMEMIIDEMLQLITAQRESWQRGARIDELLHVYDTNAVYFYGDKEDSSTVGKRINELKKGGE